MSRVLITGGNGFVGKVINNYLKDEYEVHCFGREQLDLLDKESINRRTLEFYDVVINTAVVGGNRKDVDDKRSALHVNNDMVKKQDAVVKVLTVQEKIKDNRAVREERTDLVFILKPTPAMVVDLNFDAEVFLNFLDCFCTTL